MFELSGNRQLKAYSLEVKLISFFFNHAKTGLNINVYTFSSLPLTALFSSAQTPQYMTFPSSGDDLYLFRVSARLHRVAPEPSSGPTDIFFRSFCFKFSIHEAPG